MINGHLTDIPVEKKGSLYFCQDIGEMVQSLPVSFGDDRLDLLAIPISTQALRDPSELRLHILTVQDTDPRPDGPVEQRTRCLPGHVGILEAGIDDERVTHRIGLLSVGQREDVGGQEMAMVRLHEVGPG